jgi:cytochrome c peroxidase
VGRRVAIVAATLSALVMAGMVGVAGRCHRPSARAQAASVSAPPPATLEGRALLGRAIFFDDRLSDPPGTSCASCHDPARGYAGDNGSDLGVPRGSRPGHFARRQTPSVLYLRFVRRFHFEWPEDAEHPEAYGGFFWDGRSSSIAELVRQPLFNPDEMNAAGPAAVAARLREAPYAGDLRREFDGALDSPDSAMAALGASVEAFLTSPAMAPFSSRYDAFLRGQGTLSPLEERGRALFQDPDKGNCASCHAADPRSPMPEKSLFTDFGYEAVGVPANRRLPRALGTFDLGVCERHDRSPYTDHPHFCGSFRTPSLRNVALRTSFMHNGAFTKLRDVVAFYATRGTDPARWYPGGVYDDLPPQYHANVGMIAPPYDRRPGDPPALDEGEIDAVVAFLGTLTDQSVPR